MTVRLSFCIPTRNRGDFIGECLNSILNQSGDAVEMVVVDGASTDNTSKIIGELQKRYPRLRYYYKTQNGGVDADLAEAVALASGEYCWLMSSDDMLVDGAVDRMLQEIDSGCGVYLCNRIDCTKEMHPLSEQHWLPQSYDGQCIDLSSSTGINSYLDTCTTLGGLFSYVPSVVVNRAAWLAVKDADVFYGTHYAHVPRLFSLLRSGGGLKYLSTPLVLCRMDNDSFSDKGLVHRYMIDYKGYYKISNALFNDDEITRKKFLKVIRKEHRWYRLLVLRSHMQGQQEWDCYVELLRSFGYASYLLLICGYLGGLKGLVKWAVRTRRAIARY